MPFLSVIIPVYKVEAYLPQCVESVLNQQLDDYELILVDDGSPDTCPQLCDEYGRENPCVHVIHKENGGLSSARNAGLRAATGKYVAFMDSDDWWNPEVSVNTMLETVKAHPEVDMFLFSGLDYFEGEGYFDRSDSVRNGAESVMDGLSYYKTMLSAGNLQVSACTKFLKKSFIQDAELLFEEGLLGEDNEWMIRLLRRAACIMIISAPLYICRIGRSSSITNTIHEKNVSDLLWIVEKSLRDHAASEEDHILMEHELCFCAYLWFCALGLSQRLNRDEKEELTPQFKKTAGVCRYSNSLKTKLAYSACRLLGYRAAGFILGAYIWLKGQLRFNKKRVS